MSAISSVSQKAWTAAGVVIDSHTGAQAVLERAVEDEADRDEQQHGEVAEHERAQAQARRGGQRSWRAPQRPSDADRQQHHEREHEQHDGHRRRADRVVALDLPEDVDRRELRVERDVARRPARPSRTRRPRGRSPCAAPERMAGTRLGSTIAAEDRRATRRPATRRPPPSRGRARARTGCTERTTKGSVTNSSAIRIAHVVAMAWMPTGDVGPYEREQDDADDDRRQREGQVDERVDDRLAAEAVAHEHPGDERAGHRVDRPRRRARSTASASARPPPGGS